MKLRWWINDEKPPVNGDAAKHAREEAESRLRETRDRWPDVQEAHNLLARWIEEALRGQT